MGKGARSREKNSEKNAELKTKVLEEEKKKKSKRIIVSIVSLAIVVCLGTAGLIYALNFGNGRYLRDEIVASSENFKVDNAMMTYYLRNNYAATQAQYGDYFEALTGIVSNKSLKGQISEGEKTWFDFFVDSTKTTVAEMLAADEGAKAAGIELTEVDKKYLQTSLASLEDSYYKNGITKEDITKAQELALLASKYKNKVKNDKVVSDAEIDTYFAENENTYITAGYRSYTISYTDEEQLAESAIKTFTADEAKKKSDELKAATSESMFVGTAQKIIKEVDSTLDDAAVKTKVDATLTAAGAYTAGDAMSEWIFDKSRKIGETFVNEDTANKQYIVTYLVSLPVKDSAITKNVRHILLSTNTYGSDEKAKAKADEVVALWNENKTEENFALLAAEYSDDAGSSQNGGLYEGVKSGAMVAEFDTWCFDAARKVGDSEIVKTSYGYHIMYFIGDGKEVWQETIKTDIKDKALTDDMTALKEQFATTYNEEKLTDIPA